MMERKQFFGRFVRAKRLQAKLTLEQVAELCDMSVRGYADIEVGHSDPKFSTVVKIADALHLDLNLFVAEFKKNIHLTGINMSSASHLIFGNSFLPHRLTCITFIPLGIWYTKNAISPAP